MSRARLMVVLVLALVGGGASGASAYESAAASLATENVEVVDFDYRPGSVTIAPGDTVSWDFAGDAPHTVTADDGSFDSGQLGSGETFSMRFDEAGTYRYHCSLHGGPGGEGMSGVVVVQANGDGDQPPSVDGDGDGDESASGNGNGGGNGEGSVGNDEGEALPRTGNSVPPIWIFAVSLLFSGLVLWRVSRLAGGR